MTPVRTAARTMLGSIFVVSGANAVKAPDRLVPRAKPMADRFAPVIQRSRLPAPTETRSLVQLNGAIQVAAGLLLSTRLHRPAAVVLAMTLVPTTLAGHAFWGAEDDIERSTQLTHFLKNVSLMGGLILAALDNGGRPGLAWRAKHLKNEAARTVRNTQAKTRVGMRSAQLAQRLPAAHHRHHAIRGS